MHARIMGILAAAVLLIPACAHGPRAVGSDALFQISTINALMLGVYDGDFTCGQLLQHGDFGLGTFNGLDGEMVVLDGKVYQVRADGIAYAVPDKTGTPFAAVTRFDRERVEALSAISNIETLEKEIARMAGNENAFHAIRIDGRFAHVKTRAVPKQEKPYRPLVEVTAHQPEFELHDVEGTIVGLWTPQYAQGLNVAGFHLHFLTKDRSRGGHVLECSLVTGTLAIDTCLDFRVLLPDNNEFKAADLGQDMSEQIRRVEK
jgi:acetolactate decarboxylase